MTGSRTDPSLTYVFVTLSLATFLLLFTLWRQPGVEYLTGVSLDGSPQLITQLLTPEHIIRGLREAEMVQGDHPHLPDIAGEIRSRIQWQDGELTLRTAHPQAACELLDAMVRELTHSPGNVELATIQGARVLGIRGGSVGRSQLIWLATVSIFAGLLGVFMARRARHSRLLLSRREVEKATGLPVLTELTSPRPHVMEAADLAKRRRVSRVTLRVAELSVAGVFSLMALQCCWRDGLIHRLLRDPFAAYGEVLTAFIG